MTQGTGVNVTAREKKQKWPSWGEVRREKQLVAQKQWAEFLWSERGREHSCHRAGWEETEEVKEMIPGQCTQP